MVNNIPANLMCFSGIYTIKNTIDNRFYIGSIICFKKRFQDHKSHLKNNYHANKYLQSFSNKYGADKLSFNLLYICNSSCLISNEKSWIEEMKPSFNLKKIITRKYFQDESDFEKRKFEETLRNTKSALTFLIEKCGADWWDSVVNKPEIVLVKKVRSSKNTLIREKNKLSKIPKERKRQLIEILKNLKKH